MTCTWPECEKQDCARCDVLDRCRQQVPGPFYGQTKHGGGGRYPGCGYSAEVGGIMWWAQRTGYPSHSWQFDEFRACAVRAVADRLIAWLAWPGLCFGCGNSGAHPPNLCHAEWDAPTKHPLDATPAAALRGEALVDGAIRWPTLAVILDAIEEAGMWGDVHAWRPPGSWPSHRVDQLKRDVGYAPIYTPSSPMGGV